jgi:hypothetical protein
MAQKPEEKPDVSILIEGDQGSGKGSVFEDVLGRGCIGPDNYKGTANIMEIAGDFNAIIAKQILVACDEPTFHNRQDMKTVGESIKRVITAPDHSIVRKGKDPEAMENHLRLVFLANPQNPLTFVQHDKRRYAIFKAVGKHVNDTAYWDEFHSKYCNDYHCNLFMKYLLYNIDLTGYNTRNFPITPDRLRIIGNASETSVDHFFNECTVKGEKLRIDRTHFSRAYGAWAKENRCIAFSSTKVYAQIRDKGYKEKPSDGVIYFEGFDIPTAIIDRLLTPLSLFPL